MDRQGFLARHVGLSGLAAIEIGALDHPVLAPGAAGVGYLDHLDTPGLRAKYRNDPAVDKERIVEVSHVWSGGPMSSAVPAGLRVDLLVASHVFEHIPDPVGWLLDARRLLRDDGRIFLVLPDRRFTFDLKRRDTALTDWLGWHLRRLDRPAPDQVFDHFAGVCAVSTSRAWGGADEAEFPAMQDARVAHDLAVSVAAGGDYLDVHCSVFTPFHFVALCRALSRLGLFPYRIEAFAPTEPNDIEFAALLQAAERPAVGPGQVDLQAIARAAGYRGEFGGGRLRAALDADPALRGRYEAAVAAARAEAAAQWDARLADFPALDPALHHDRPRQGDPRL